MSEVAQSISYFDLIYTLIPVGVVIYILLKWRLKFSTVIYAHVRMFIQLIAIGYCLKYIFNNDHPAIILLVLAVMITIAGYIAPRPLKKKTVFPLFILDYCNFFPGSYYTLHCNPTRYSC